MIGQVIDNGPHAAGCLALLFVDDMNRHRGRGELGKHYFQFAALDLGSDHVRQDPCYTASRHRGGDSNVGTVCPQP